MPDPTFRAPGHGFLSPDGSVFSLNQHSGQVVPWAWFSFLPTPPPPTPALEEHTCCQLQPGGQPCMEECGGFQLWHPSCTQPSGSAPLPWEFSRARCALRPSLWGGGDGDTGVLQSRPSASHKNPPSKQLCREEQSRCVQGTRGCAVGVWGGVPVCGQNSECGYVHEHGEVFCLCEYGWKWYECVREYVCIQGGRCGVRVCVKGWVLYINGRTGVLCVCVCVCLNGRIG